MRVQGAQHLGLELLFQRDSDSAFSSSSSPPRGASVASPLACGAAGHADHRFRRADEASARRLAAIGLRFARRAALRGLESTTSRSSMRPC